MNDPKMPYFAELIIADARNARKSKFEKHLISDQGILYKIERASLWRRDFHLDAK